MASFSAGKSAIWLTVYFFIFFTLLSGVVSLSIYYGVDQNIHFKDTGFTKGALAEPYINNSASSGITSDYTMANVLTETIGFALGFNKSVTLGLPSAWAWLFRFIMVYVPSVLLIYASVMGVNPFGSST